MNRILSAATLCLAAWIAPCTAAEDEATILDEVQVTSDVQPLPCLGCDARPAPEPTALRLMRFLLLPAEPPIPDRAATLAHDARYGDFGPDTGPRF
jgi:hypothetical protein